MGQGLGGVFELVVVDDVGDETEVQGLIGGEEISGQQHPHRRLRRHRTRQRHHRRRAEQADPHPGRRESRRGGRNREIAAGHELASGGRGHPLNLGDDRLRDPLDQLHELGADGEELLLVVRIGPADLLEVVAGTEHVTGRAEDHRAHIGVPPHLGEGVDERAHDVTGQGVAGFGCIDRHRHDTVVERGDYN